MTAGGAPADASAEATADATTLAETKIGQAGRRGVRITSTDLLMLLTVVIWGINFTAVKVALNSMAPLAFNAVRFSLATVVTFAVLALQSARDWRFVSDPRAGRDAGRIILLGLVGHSIYQVLFGNGMARTAPGNASLMMATAPIWVAILGYLLAIERVNRMMAAGIALSFAGITLLITSGGKVSLGSGNIAGDAMLLGCAILWATFTVASKPLLARHSPLELTAWTMLAGTIPLVLVSIPQLRQQDWSAVPPLAWGSLLYSAVLSATVGYVLWSVSVKRVGNARTAIYSNLTPVIAILFAWVALGDKLAPLQLLGGFIVLVGLIVTRRGRSR